MSVSLRPVAAPFVARIRRIEARLQARLAAVDWRLAAGTVSVVRGGKALLRKRGNLAAAGLDEDRWRDQWESARLFLTADGEKDKALGNETIRWHPYQGWLELKLPGLLARLANRPHGRYRLSCPVEFSYRGGEVAAQTAMGAVRYHISRDPASGRWYLDASWKPSPTPGATLDELRASPVLAVDLNHGHLAAWAVTPDGNPAGPPVTRNGRPRQAPRQPHPRHKTATATRTYPPDQAAQDRPGPPASQDHLLLVQQER